MQEKKTRPRWQRHFGATPSTKRYTVEIKARLIRTRFFRRATERNGLSIPNERPPFGIESFFQARPAGRQRELTALLCWPASLIIICDARGLCDAPSRSCRAVIGQRRLVFSIIIYVVVVAPILGRGAKKDSPCRPSRLQFSTRLYGLLLSYFNVSSVNVFFARMVDPTVATPARGIFADLSESDELNSKWAIF